MRNFDEGDQIFMDLAASMGFTSGLPLAPGS